MSDQLGTMSYVRSAFGIIFGTYLIVLALDLLRPGFASRWFVVHILLVISIVLFVVLLAKGERWRDRGLPQGIVWAFGIVLAWIAWSLGATLEEGRLLVSLLALVTPYLLDHLLLQVS